MTVRANDVTLGDLVEHGLPATVTKVFADGELLVSEVIELQDEGIELATVDAASLTEELDEICRALGSERMFATHSVRHVPFSVLQIVLLFIRGATRTAVVVELSAS